MQYTPSRRWHQSTRLHGVTPWNKTIRTVPLVMPYVCDIHFNTCIMRFSALSPRVRRLEREAVISPSAVSRDSGTCKVLAVPRSPAVEWGGVRGTMHRILTFVVGFSDWILFFWQKAVVSIHVKTSGSKAAIDHRVAETSKRLSVYKAWFGDHASMTRLLSQKRCKCSSNLPLPLRSWKCHLS